MKIAGIKNQKELQSQLEDLGFRVRFANHNNKYRAYISLSGYVNNIWWNNPYVIEDVFVALGWSDVKIVRTSTTCCIVEFGDIFKLLSI